MSHTLSAGTMKRDLIKRTDESRLPFAATAAVAFIVNKMSRTRYLTNGRGAELEDIGLEHFQKEFVRFEVFRSLYNGRKMIKTFKII